MSRVLHVYMRVVLYISNTTLYTHTRAHDDGLDALVVALVVCVVVVVS